jgi:WD40 repeat protein
LVAFAPDGKTLASGSGYRDKENAVLLWDPATGQVRATLKAGSGYVRSLSFARDGKRLACGSSSGEVVVWDLATRTPLARWQAHREDTHTVRFYPDGARLVSASQSDRDVVVWDAATGKELLRVRASAAGVSILDLSPDGKLLVVSSSGGFRLRDAATGAPLRFQEAHRDFI